MYPSKYEKVQYISLVVYGILSPAESTPDSRYYYTVCICRPKTVRSGAGGGGNPGKVYNGQRSAAKGRTNCQQIGAKWEFKRSHPGVEGSAEAHSALGADYQCRPANDGHRNARFGDKTSQKNKTPKIF